MKWISSAVVCLVWLAQVTIADDKATPTPPSEARQREQKELQAIQTKHGFTLSYPGPQSEAAKQKRAYEKALPALRQLVKKGNMVATAQLALYIRDSNRTKAGLQEAVTLFDQAAKMPTVTAAERASIAEEKETAQKMLSVLFGEHQSELAALYAVLGKHGIPVHGGERPKLSKEEWHKKLEIIMPELRKLVDNNNVMAAVGLAKFIRDINPTKKDLQEVITLYDRAEKMKHVTTPIKNMIQAERTSVRQQLAALAKSPVAVSVPKKTTKNK